MWWRRNEELGSSEEERSLSRLGELLLLVERTKKAAAMPATAAQCFGSTETLQAYLHNPVREFSSKKPDDFPWRAQRERFSMFWSWVSSRMRRRRRTAFSCCRGNRLQRSVPEWRFSSVLNRRPPRAEASVREAESRRDSIGGRRSQRARQQTSLWCSRPALRNTPAIVGLRPTCLRACAHLYLKVGLRWHWQWEPRDQEGRIQNNQKSGCWWKPRQHLHRYLARGPHNCQSVK